MDYAYDSCGSYTRGPPVLGDRQEGHNPDVSRTAYNRYDALGRVLESTQTTGGTPYTMAYAYDRAGNLILPAVPLRPGGGLRLRRGGEDSGSQDRRRRLVCRRDGGRTRSDYGPHGGVKQLLLGNGLWEQRRYNARLQPTQIGLGTATATGGLTATGPTPTASLLLLDYSYGASSNNGNVLSQRIRVGTSLNQNQVLYLRRAEPAEDGRGDRQRHRLVADLRLRPLRQPPGDGGGLPRVEPGPDAPVDGRHRRRHQPAGRGSTGVNAVAYDAAGNLKADWSANAFKYDGDNRLVAFDAPLGHRQRHHLRL